MLNLSAISDFDILFYYNTQGSDLTTETQSDLMLGLIQPQRSMFYNRSEGCGINERENYPNALSFQVQAKMDIINWISKRNLQVSDGSNGQPDRRIASSQSAIVILQDNKGNADISVFYLPLNNVESPQAINTKITGGQ